MPKISVIMSIYKEPIDWVCQSIDSILAQTFSDFEFIIVNDRPDRVENAQLLDEYKAKDERVIVLTNETNIGLTKSLNKALDIAQGEYIARMDADDISLPQRFDVQVAYLDQHPKICGCGSWTGSIDETGERLEDVGRYETDPRWVRAQFLQNSQVGHPAAMFRKVTNGHVVRYNEEIRYAQDYSLWVSLLPYGEITNIPEVLFCYRTSEQQITTIKKLEQQTCAGVAQRMAFELFGFQTSEEFLSLFFAFTIQHDMNKPFNEVRTEFRKFYEHNKLTENNALALELIYSSYLAYLRHQSNGSYFKFIQKVISCSTLTMLHIGFKLVWDLHRRKSNRRQ